MRFLCDHMLLNVGHWLRVAGYDTVMAEPHHRDRDLVAWAMEESRVMLTCDRLILEIKHAPEHVVVVGSNQVDQAAAEIARALDVDWLYAPLTRCLKCNVVLSPGRPEHEAVIPEVARQGVTEVRYCAPCDQVFWDGTHADAMLERLEMFRQRALEDVTP